MIHSINDIENQYLIFRVEDKEYGVNLLHIQEITEHLNITPIPMATDLIRGIINLRGKIIPILDIKRKLEAKKTDLTKEGVIIVLNFEVEYKPYIVGMLADEAIEVFDISPSQINKSPTFFSDSFLSKFLSGLYDVDSRTIFILDPEVFFSVEEKEIIKKGETQTQKTQQSSKENRNDQAEYNL